MAQNSFTLIRDAQATLIPAGDRLSLKEGTEVFVTQALGGTVTVQAHGGLYRIESEDLDDLGEEGQGPKNSRPKLKTLWGPLHRI